MKRFGVLLLIIALKLPAFTQQLSWANRTGSSCSENSKNVVTDANGNTIVVGSFCGTVDFDPGSGTAYLSDNGFDNLFVQKLDANGDFVWAVSIGGSSYDIANAVAVDDANNVYVTGFFSGTVDFDPGPATAFKSSNGYHDIFVLKLSANGIFQWVKTLGGIDDDEANGLVFDTNTNDLYLTGDFEETVDFDPGPGNSSLTAANNYYPDVFILKLTSNGDFIWAKSFEGTNSDTGKDVALDINGNVYLTGSFQGTVDFDPSSATNFLTSNGLADAFVTKLNSNGDLMWARSFGGNETVYGNSIKTDASGNVYSVGNYKGTVDLDPSGGGSNFTSSTQFYDFYIQKLDPNGNFVWGYGFGDGVDDYANDLSLDTDNNVYVTGGYSGTIDFDPGSGAVNLTSNGVRDIYILKLSEIGDYLWADNFGSGGNDEGKAIHLDSYQNIYTAGYFGGTSDFDPGSGTFYLTPLDNEDIFVQKLHQCTPAASTDTQVACDSYTWIDGNTYTSSNNTATHTLTAANSCDSVVTLNLTINQSTTATDIIEACESYTWIDGNTYTADNNQATYLFTNTAGCDSLVSLNLTIHLPDTTVDQQQACDSYTWIDGVTYTSNNNSATYTLTNQEGCDSVVFLSLTINSINNGITINGSTLQADQTGIYYQWLDCNDNYAPIAGETGQLFEPDENGTYAVELIDGTCVDTSDCVVVEGIGITETTQSLISVYPNPTTGPLMIRTDLNDLELTLLSTDGKVVLKKSAEGANVVYLNLEHLEKGVYLLLIESDEVKVNRKIVLN